MASPTNTSETHVYAFLHTESELHYKHRHILGIKRPMKSKLSNILLILFTASMFTNVYAITDNSSIKCTYSSYSDQEGSHNDVKDFNLNFQKGSGSDKFYLIGNQGNEEVLLLPGMDSISFLERTPVGNITITTIDNYGNSVHSRNIVIGGKIVPSQYYGKCTTE